MTVITVSQEIFEKLKQAYSEKFGSSPSLLISELNRSFQDKREASKDLISDKTIRNFFNRDTPIKSQEKNLNYLCNVLLDSESYQEFLRRQESQFEENQVTSRSDKEWLDCYREYVSVKCGNVRVLTMAYPIALSSMYTKVNVLRRFRGRKLNLTTANREVTDESYYHKRVFIGEEISALDAVEQYHKLFIWGSPGIGKTTFLKYLALRPIENREDLLIPVFISLKAFADQQDSPSLFDAVEQEFAGCVAEPTLLAATLLQQGACLILLDGLDEVVSTKIDYVYQAISAFVKQHARNRFVMTCRSGATEYVFEDFTEVKIANFNSNQINSFAQKWFAACSEPKLEEKFFEGLYSNSSSVRLAENPLLLTLLCLVFEDTYEVTRNHNQLIEEAVDVFLRRWDATRRIDRKSINGLILPIQHKVKLLGKIAFEALSQQPPKYLWQQKELENIICNYVQNFSGSSSRVVDIDDQSALKEIEANHGLLVEIARGVYSFSHSVFQEYFTALHIVENRNISLKAILDEHLLNRQWKEVLLVIAGRLPDADELLKYIFKQADALAKSETLQSLLSWLDEVTTLHEVSSSSWRAWYLAVDQELQLYTANSRGRSHTLAQNLAHVLKKDSEENGTIILRSQQSYLGFLLARGYDRAVKASNEEDRSQEISPFLGRELPAGDFANVPKLEPEISVDKEKGTIAVDKQRSIPTVSLDVNSVQKYFPTQQQETGSKNSTNQKQKVFALLEELEYHDLAEEMFYLLDTYPRGNASSKRWKKWAKELQALMMLYLHIGYSVKLSQEDVSSLEDYCYVNTLLVECIRGSYSSKILREQIIDNLLRPSRSIPPELFASSLS